ncbi:Cobalt-zinc-cadmium resistance protein czcD [Roseomonas mucosa]|jgi:cation diffusion facilitator family transporter|uniref:Cobalt-zinc-cadmium resistance protein czcD n=1 Tax=Roseomonas mucosa TaxID=207340 RepID=A0A4Y1N251_9PROT|nr:MULTISPECIES: cation diffusion facilitator family transporter [Roseomonas]ATR22631.1 cation-efflux pump [Roseomonas sp. FDAARGOS_362]AWV24366.1 Cobalt-zinc-cadmium resistance protein czcD [Roseomonas mucosa]MDT8274907.1 cation diffusion facilitator family transporter [Roseomonas mucosa]MDT8355568.1 cation diffusion facilitator family transporter [Roseomonas mucosa]MDU7521589.1 cation diffusion facilitator family transporter [Roseomonas mucosa]
MSPAIRLALGSILFGLVVLGLKFAAWRVTGSVALYSDALESIINVATAGTTALALWVSQRPADAGHPYGHGKAEYFSAVLEGVLIVLAALSILREAWFGFLSPTPVEAPLLGLAINAAATLLNGAWATVLLRAGRARQSPALLADARHLFTDVFTSGGVLLGFVLVPLTGWPLLDPALAALVALNILWSGAGVVRSSVGGLMDAAPDKEVMRRLRGIISRNADGALEAHDLRAHRVGGRLFLECHLVLPGDMPLREAHAVCNRVEEALGREMGDIVATIHPEPEEEAQRHGVLVL